jgi:glutamate-1-semialdehyde 2,1-aminomutase
LLIFDEVITGFRLSLGGAQRIYRVQPDLVTLGKALGGGLPLSALAGRADLMDRIGEGVSFGGTFNGNPLSLAAGLATIQELGAERGAALTRANTAGDALMAGLLELARKRSIPLRVTGFGAAFSVHFTEREQLLDYRDTLDDDRERLQRFLLASLEEGIYLLPDGRFYVSTTHSQRVIDETLAAFDRVFARLN